MDVGKISCIFFNKLKGLVKDVYNKEFGSVSAFRPPRMFQRGLTGPEMKFLDGFC